VLVHPESGSPQGGVISPLLSNIYLHEVFDRWWVAEVLPRMRGRAFAVRYADDLVLAFSEQSDAERVRRVMSLRFKRFGLTLHPEKTRLVRYTRPGPEGGDEAPGSFDFLGFTHHWARSRNGRWVMKRTTSTSRFTRALKALNQWMRRERHLPVAEQAKILGKKLRGHYGYYGIRWNARALARLGHEAQRLWYKWLARRSQRGLTWSKFSRLLKHYPLPPPRTRPRRYQLKLTWANP
jgi:RNA-directed DNA polymerase